MKTCYKQKSNNNSNRRCKYYCSCIKHKSLKAKSSIMVPCPPNRKCKNVAAIKNYCSKRLSRNNSNRRCKCYCSCIKSQKFTCMKKKEIKNNGNKKCPLLQLSPCIEKKKNPLLKYKKLKHLKQYTKQIKWFLEILMEVLFPEILALLTIKINIVLYALIITTYLLVILISQKIKKEVIK